MKTIKNLLLATALTAMMALPAAAQQNTGTVDNTNTYSDNDGRMSPWWGLLGLIGLFGLMRRNENQRIVTDQRNPR